MKKFSNLKCIEFHKNKNSQVHEVEKGRFQRYKIIKLANRVSYLINDSKFKGNLNFHYYWNEI